MKKLLKSKSSPGFTLIELMIVIVIIGLLSGILIALINPTKTQNRARDATIKAAINKIALAAGAFNSATGAVPQGIELPGELTTNVIVGTTAASSALFTVNGNPLPLACTAGTWNTTGSAACSYYYCAGDNGTNSALPTTCAWSAGLQDYKIMAKSYAGNPSVYMFRANDSRLYICAAAGSPCSLAN